MEKSDAQEPSVEQNARNHENLAVYLHWPFCLSKCPYCDFNSHVASTINHESWKKGFLSEIKRSASSIGNRQVTSIFFGGGTPSLMDPNTVSEIIDLITQLWSVAERVEITIEANPSSSDVSRFRAFRSAGINRVSLGIQSLQNNSLKFLGREHTAAEGISAAQIGAKVFDRISIDLIYGRPEQTVKDWRNELQMALDLINNHISVYQLTIEKGTPFYDLARRGSLMLPSEGIAADLYQTTQGLLEEVGLPAYEVSNHASKGNESQHNLTYWQYGDYLGIGPGAHSRIMIDSQIQALEQFRQPARWLLAASSEKYGTSQKKILSRSECAREMVMMGLRLKTGLNRKSFHRRIGLNLEDILNTATLSTLEDANLVSNDRNSLRLTPRGLLVLDSVLARIFP